MLSIDKFSHTPIYEQIVDAVQREVMLRIIGPGEQIPSLREMSAHLGINPNTIQKAYLELARRGVIASAQGSGYFVTAKALEVVRRQAASKLPEIENLAYKMAMAGIDQKQVTAAVDKAYLRAGKSGSITETGGEVVSDDNS